MTRLKKAWVRDSRVASQRAETRRTIATGLMVLACAGAMQSAVSAENVEPKTRPAGSEIKPTTSLLKAGATVLQTDRPVDAMNVYLSGFHPMKHAPTEQLSAHHFCNQINEDFAQCALFDGNTRTANLTGIEYIISEKLFASLPASERKYWHPHNYEILSGQLVAPGLPAVAEKALMKTKMNSYGKTWHVWDTGNATRGGDRLPLGDPMLAWSFNRDGEAAAGLVEARDKALEVDSKHIRKQRADLAPLAKPQSGVDALRDRFPKPTKPFPGVSDSARATVSLYTELHRFY